MDEQLETGVLVDSSVVIDFLRKQKKERSAYMRFVDRNTALYMSVVTAFEVQVGIRTERHRKDFLRVRNDADVLPLDEACIAHAVDIQRALLANNAVIGLPDLFIAATSMRHDLPLATLNWKHFRRVNGLELVPHHLLVSE